ncbi:pleckstrin homology (PH) domain superfamily protein [Actinidia rufa]|uniref:Pleckstrin homology (PH) domain superfamily protein n=1 Tax=Actinidia rufa TaxID=165716 RepID=A0A7J0GXK5_9ERIC|nr:pleckstrin homology (PH) domain superfamily protein [Actinidia rufa]
MSSSTEPQHKEDEEATGPTAAEDEDTGAQVAPIVKLQEVAVSTGEEHENVLLDLKAKLYRFDKEGNQWKERGGGTVKLLEHKETSKVRLVMRQSKTLKICANHLVLASISIQEHAGNDKSCVWHANDFSDGELKEELFCIRFASVENCKTFKEKIKEVAQLQEKEGESKEATSTADLLEKLSVGDNKEPEEKKEAPAEEKKEESEKQESPVDEK